MAIRSTPRARSTLLTILAAAVVCVSTGSVGGETVPPSAGGPAPNFALTTQQNDRLWLTQLRGRAVVLGFACTACGACPDLVPGLAKLARGMGDAPGRRVFFAVVTVDPARDTPAVLREFGRLHGLRAPAWLFLTEDRMGQVEVVTRRYGVAVRRVGERVEADCALTLIDGDGRIRARHDLGSIEALDRDLRTLLARPSSR